MTINFSQTAAFIWAVADLLRGDFKQSQYGRIILPFTLLRRLECVLEKSKDAVLAKHAEASKMGLPEEAYEKMMLQATDERFFNISPMDLSKLGEAGIKENLEKYIQSFSKDAREIFEYFKFPEFIGQLNDANLLYKVVQKFANTDLHPEAISNYEMGLVFEELIRRFAESSNETAGEHFTPRDIVHLTTSLVFMEDDEALTQEGVIRTIYDPTAGTGGFLSSGMEYVYEINPNTVMRGFGQELNPQSYAICKADMLIKGQEVDRIKLGNTLSNDQLYADKFDYMLSNPPFGVEWKKVEKEIRDEHTLKGFGGRFGPGLPRVSDGSLLFLMHLISKLRDTKDGGGRIGIILNGSPLLNGGAGSGESEIRRYIAESDLLEAIIALPGGAFFNTSIPSFVLILTNKKKHENKDKIKLIDARSTYSHMRKRVGLKSIFLGAEEIEEITKAYSGNPVSGMFKSISCSDCGYRVVKLNLPGKKLEYEEIPLLEDIDDYLNEQLEDIYPGFKVDDSYVDLKDNKIGRILYRFNFDELFAGFRKKSGVQFRFFFEEVSVSDSYDFSVRSHMPKVFFKADNEGKKGFWYFRLRAEKEIDLDYLRLYMESGKGDEWILKYTTDGTAVRKISKPDLMQSTIDLPTIETQKNIVSLMGDVGEIGEGLSDFVRDLWRKKSVSYDGERLKLPLYLDFQEQFVRFSPFPLANILHHYISLDDEACKERYELLLKYFEGLSIFLVSALIGYLIDVAGDNKVFNFLKSQNRFIKNASFGAWGSLLKKAPGKLDIEISAADHKFIQLVANHEIVDLIDEATSIRNKTTGHGSYPTKEAAKKTLSNVESLLGKSYELTHLLFNEYQLVRPISSIWDGQQHIYNVQSFSGLGCYPFGQRKLNLKTLLIDGELHLVSKQGTEVVKLFPFLKLMDMGNDSGLDAFYFFSGIHKEDLNGSDQTSGTEYKFISHQQINNQSRRCSDSTLDRIFS